MTRPDVGDRVWRTEDGKITFDGYVSCASDGGFQVWCYPKDRLPIPTHETGWYVVTDDSIMTPAVSTLSLMLSLDGWSWVPYDRNGHPMTPERTEEYVRMLDAVAKHNTEDR